MNQQKLLIVQQNSIFFIESNKIIFMQSDNCYTTIFLTGGKTILACKSISKLQKELEPEIFIRVSQSYLINRSSIEHIDKKKKSIGLTENHNIGYTIALKTLMVLLKSQVSSKD